MHEYERACAQCPTHPLAFLCLAAATLGYAMSRTVPRRHRSVVEAFISFRKYQMLRKEHDGAEYEAETWYNLGRGFHQISIFKLAFPCYERCLELLRDYDDRPDRTALKRACAWNLQLLYATVRNYKAAQEIIDMYLVIE